MKRKIDYQISKTQAGINIWDFLKGKKYPESFLITLKNTEQSILVNEISVRLNTILQENDLLEVCFEEKGIPFSGIYDLLSPTFPYSLNILYEDEDILVLYKPPFMPVQPSRKEPNNSLGNYVIAYMNHKYPGQYNVFHCMNRLDKNTSGLVLVAKHRLAGAILSEDIKQNRLQKEYIAIVEGNLEGSGTIQAPIAKCKDNGIKREINYETGKNAITHYSAIASNRDYSVIRLWLETGRTHQIRVHMAYIGHPLVGDEIYNPQYYFGGITEIRNPQYDFEDKAETCKSQNIFFACGANIESNYNNKAPSRHLLHVHQLNFTHPITNKEMDFTCDIPDDMKEFMAGK